jgi:PAS domain S-box-containing protein
MPTSLFLPFSQDASGKFSSNAMLRRVRDFDWSASPLGDISAWPEPIKFAARTLLLSPTAMTLLVGREGRVIHNDAAGRMFSCEGALGRPVADALPDLSDLFEAALRDCFEGKGVQCAEQHVTLHRNGVPVSAWFDMSFTPVADADGTIYGALMSCSDITERVQALRELKRSRERLDLSIRHGGIVGTWEVDFSTDTITSNERFAQLHGVDPELARTGAHASLFVPGIHPDDRRTVMESFDRAKAGLEEYRLQHRVIGTGEVRWIVASGQMVADETGKLSTFFGVVVDVTEQVQANLALAESERLLRALADTVPQSVFSADADGATDYLNKRWWERTGLKPGEISEELWQSLVHPEDRERAVSAWRHAVDTGERFDIEMRTLDSSGEYRWIRAMALPYRDAEGRITRWFGTNTDIHDAAQLSRERELVAGELDHRVKNLFALVSSLIRVSQRENPEMAGFGEKLTLRLTALREAHDLIRQSGRSDDLLSSVSLRSLIERLLKPYVRSDRNVGITGPEVMLAPGAVTPLALVFHELTTNAVKYGGLASDEGRLAIIIEPDTAGTHITWLETGLPTEGQQSAHAGFGSSLLSLAIERQLRGTLVREFGAGSLTIRLSLPAIWSSQPAAEPAPA